MFDVTTVQQACQAPIYDIILTEKEAWEALKRLDPEEVYALDFETTSLSPDDGKVRLSTISGHGVNFIIDHFYAGDFEIYARWFAEHDWAVFNAGFEGDWIDYHSDSIDVELYDVGHMRRAKMGGGPLSLKIQAKKDLKIDMDKDEQASNWSKPILDKSQYDYAMIDGIITFGLWEKWKEELSADQWAGFMVINDAWRGTKEMELTGLVLDVPYHQTLLNWWTLKRDTAERYLRKWAPPSVLANIRSKPQLTKFFQNNILDEASFEAWPKTGKRGDLNMERDTLRQAAHRLPYPMSRWVGALIIFNKMEKYVGTYGQKLIDAQSRLGRVPTRFNMAQAITCRYSSSNFNLQNIPRNKVVRRSFIASTHDRDTRLVMADYSSIEVRVLAELANDAVLREDAIYGDVHSRSASQIFRIEYDHFVEVLGSDDPKHANAKAVFKDLRSRAKAFTFQLLYGAGGPALAVVLRCSDDEAFKAIDAWAEVYPKAFHYRTLMWEKMNHNGFLPVCDGRTIFVFRDDRTMPVAANYPVQGAAASVMYRGVYHCHRKLWHTPYRARMAASVHDELLMFSHVSCSEQVGQLLVDSMVQGWLDIFPNTDINNLVGKGNKATIGMHWGEKV
jgi:DNA polymerase I-like protein with 3'-5' exonuclease and polymerase domains